LYGVVVVYGKLRVHAATAKLLRELQLERLKAFEANCTTKADYRWLANL